MNVIEMIEGLDFYLDRVNSSRFTNPIRTRALNISTNDIIEDRYDNIRKNKTYSFEVIQRVRDELYTIVKTTAAMTPTGNSYPTAQITAQAPDYKYGLTVKCLITGNNYWAVPCPLDREPTIDLDPYERPKITYPPRVYFIQRNVGIEMLFGATGTLGNGFLEYLANPNTIIYGVQRDSTFPGPAGGIACIAIVELVYATITYPIGATFTLANGTFITSPVGVPAFVTGFTNPSTPKTLDEEIMKRASSYLLKGVESYNKGFIAEKDSETT